MYYAFVCWNYVYYIHMYIHIYVYIIENLDLAYYTVYTLSITLSENTLPSYVAVRHSIGQFFIKINYSLTSGTFNVQFAANNDNAWVN